MGVATGFIFYEGKSELDGSNIVGIATLQSTNRKIGNMVQTWILPAWTEPHIAAKTGEDTAVCGDCPLRPSESGICYVLTFQGPLAIYRAYKNDRYPRPGDWTYNATLDKVRNRMVRLGAYGDPAAIPRKAWVHLLLNAKGWTGYTHQWKQLQFDWLRNYCQASVDTPEEKSYAEATGWRTFAVLPVDAPVPANTTLCPAEKHDGAQCITCGLCNGKKRNVAIHAHGKGKNKV